MLKYTTCAWKWLSITGIILEFGIHCVTRVIPLKPELVCVCVCLPGVHLFYCVFVRVRVLVGCVQLISFAFACTWFEHIQNKEIQTHAHHANGASEGALPAELSSCFNLITMLCRIWHEYFTYYDEISINLSINLSVSKAETCYRLCIHCIMAIRNCKG